MTRAAANLRMVEADENAAGQPEERQEPSLTFDPDLDLGGIRPEDEQADGPQSTRATEPRRGGKLSGLFRAVLYVFGVLLILLVALVMYLRGSQDPSSAPLVTASVPVLESALAGAGQVKRDDQHTTAIQAENQEVAIVPQEPSVEPHVTVPVAADHVTATATDSALNSSTSVLESPSTIITEMQQMLSEHRQLIHDQLEQNKQFQAELQDIRTSSEVTSLRVDSLAADLAQVRRSLEDLTAREAKKVATLQRQLAVKNEQARQIERQREAQRREPPPFRVLSVTLWGADYLATLTLNSGQQWDVTVGELLEGWKIDSISATGISVTRLRDGTKLSLAAGVL